MMEVKQTFILYDKVSTKPQTLTFELNKDFIFTVIVMIFWGRKLTQYTMYKQNFDMKNL